MIKSMHRAPPPFPSLSTFPNKFSCIPHFQDFKRQSLCKLERRNPILLLRPKRRYNSPGSLRGHWDSLWCQRLWGERG